MCVFWIQNPLDKQIKPLEFKNELQAESIIDWPAWDSYLGTRKSLISSIKMTQNKTRKFPEWKHEEARTWTWYFQTQVSSRVNLVVVPQLKNVIVQSDDSGHWHCDPEWSSWRLADPAQGFKRVPLINYHQISQLYN
jgi:hypothetical protein